MARTFVEHLDVGTTSTAGDITAFMEKLAAKLQGMQPDHPKSDFLGLEPHPGKKFCRINRRYRDKFFDDDIKVVDFAYCFIEMNTGDIYKAETSGKPAKHVRGNIFSDDPTACCRWKGIELLVKPKDHGITITAILISRESGHEKAATGEEAIEHR